uniref:NADH dehydrogenase subunit 2 n=1 Tax=Margattea concava TaxID=1928781 RepID=UPI00279C8DBB|nr:NADH dehydrogenase subunit 2 [Margattea concava]WGO57288.1 NADH dehydrogenase subunit 2 [Margattea concava]
MPNSSAKIMFFFTLMSGMLITVSSNSWFAAWLGLEINLLSFIPILMNNNNIYSTEAALKYFLIQVLASSTFLFLIGTEILLKTLSIKYSTLIVISSPLVLKSGTAPLHWWFPSVMEGLNWNNCLIMMTIQKIAPLILLSLLLNSSVMISLSILSILIGSIGGINQSSIRKMLTYSSINHVGWMLSALMIGETMWIMYFVIYSMLTTTIIMIIQLLNISFTNQINMINNNLWLPKFSMSLSLLSLGGLPPFLGFLPKWIIIQVLTNNNMIFQIAIMVILSLMTLYYYMRICYSSFLILHLEPSWNYFKTNISLSNSTFLILSIIGLLISPSLIVFI